MKNDHWFKFYYKLILISCQGWKDDEFGAYVRLLINQFDRGGLPDDPIQLSKLITSYKKNWPLLSKKFKKGKDGLLRNDFMIEVRKDRDEKVKQNVLNGKMGGKANAKRLESERLANGLDSPKRKGSQLRYKKGDKEYVYIESWESDKKNFSNDYNWKEKFTHDKKISMNQLNQKMTEFISDLELKEDYKDLKELKYHFTNWFNLKTKIPNHQKQEAPAGPPLRNI